MFFQLLDNKFDCAGTYIDGSFVWERIPNGLSKTWAYSDHLYGMDIDYAQLLVAGVSLNDVCPIHLTQRWEEANNLLKGHYKAINASSIDISDVCFYDLIPQKHLQHYFDTKNEITRWVFDNVERPEHYNLLKRTQAAVKELKRHPVNLNVMGSITIHKPTRKQTSLRCIRRENTVCRLRHLRDNHRTNDNKEKLVPNLEPQDGT